MEELIQIAFSAINKRVEMVEKEIKNLYKTIDELEKVNQKHQTKIEELLLESYNKNLNRKDEMEEYKFGE